MRIEAVELRRVAMPLVRPFRTAFGTQDQRDVLLVRVATGEGADGWGECVAPAAPIYSSEWTEGAAAVVRRFLAPALLARDQVRADDVAEVLGGLVGHRMAKAALEMAVLDAELRAEGRPLAARLGAVRSRVRCGVSVGIAASIPALLEEVGSFLDEGYVRIKLKIEPGWDVEPVAAVRERFGDVPLQVDGNCGYPPEAATQLAALDQFELLLIEQPYGEEHLLAHAALARRMRTPICLDESITSAQAAVDALAVGACSVVNIKAGRVGGYLEATRIHDRCAALGVPVWCGGMLETGLGRAANLALAALPAMGLPGDTSASDRYFPRDLTEPFVLDPEGCLPVPSGPGLGVEPLEPVLREVTTGTETIRR